MGYVLRAKYVLGTWDDLTPEQQALRLAAGGEPIPSGEGAIDPDAAHNQAAEESKEAFDFTFAVPGGMSPSAATEYVNNLVSSSGVVNSSATYTWTNQSTYNTNYSSTSSQYGSSSGVVEVSSGYADVYESNFIAQIQGDQYNAWVAAGGLG